MINHIDTIPNPRFPINLTIPAESLCKPIRHLTFCHREAVALQVEYGKNRAGVRRYISFFLLFDVPSHSIFSSLRPMALAILSFFWRLQFSFLYWFFSLYWFQILRCSFNSFQFIYCFKIFPYYLLNWRIVHLIL